jgi:hypothetical protein
VVLHGLCGVETVAMPATKNPTRCAASRAIGSAAARGAAIARTPALNALLLAVRAAYSRSLHIVMLLVPSEPCASSESTLTATVLVVQPS